MHNDWRDLIKPKAVEFDEKELTPTYGRFFAEPLERGYGIDRQWSAPYPVVLAARLCDYCGADEKRAARVFHHARRHDD